MEQQSPHQPPVMGPVTPPYKQRKKAGIAKEVLSTVGVLLLAPIAAIIFTAFVFQFYRVDGPSMEQTLQNNDRLIVYKLPKSFANLTNRDYLPGRGDIVVFNQPEESGESRQLIKRVIGLPGDRVVVKDNVVRLYNSQHPNGYDPDEGTQHQESTIPTAGSLDITVPDDQVFVLGDNRVNSLDSRVFGPIKTENIVGKLALRVFPFKPIDD
jgi:signal peptidase I